MKEIKNFFTRKNAIIIFAVILSVVVAIFSAILVIHKFSSHKGDKENGSYESVVESEVTDTSESENQSIEQNPETVTSQPSVSTNQVQSQKPLSPEEIAMREEIAKVSDTAIEFPYTRQIVFDGVTYNAVYSGLVETRQLANKYRALYRTETLYEFEFDLSTGKLMGARLPALYMSEKPENAISSSKAETIARNFYDELDLTYGYSYQLCREGFGGYTIRYAAPDYMGYSTDDCVVIVVNYNGKITTLQISDFHYDDLGLNISDAKIQAKMQDPIYQTEEGPTASLSCSKGQIYVDIRPVKEEITEIPAYSIEEFLED